MASENHFASALLTCSEGLRITEKGTKQHWVFAGAHSLWGVRGNQASTYRTRGSSEGCGAKRKLTVARLTPGSRGGTTMNEGRRGGREGMAPGWRTAACAKVEVHVPGRQPSRASSTRDGREPTLRPACTAAHSPGPLPVPCCV